MFLSGYLWSRVEIEIVVTIPKHKKLILIKDSMEREGLKYRALSAVSMSSKIFLMHFLLIETVIVSCKLE